MPSVGLRIPRVPAHFAATLLQSRYRMGRLDVLLWPTRFPIMILLDRQGRADRLRDEEHPINHSGYLDQHGMPVGMWV